MSLVTDVGLETLLEKKMKYHHVYDGIPSYKNPSYRQAIMPYKSYTWNLLLFYYRIKRKKQLAPTKPDELRIVADFLHSFDILK